MNGKKINLDFGAIFRKIAGFFRNFSRLPKDEQYAYMAIGVGIIFVILGLVV